MMHILFLSCLKATELVEKKLHFCLSGKEKIQLKVHNMMCEACASYEKHSIFLEKGIAARKIEELDPKDLKDLKLAIQERLAKA